jgi:protein-tyrosine phosphatase
MIEGFKQWWQLKAQMRAVANAQRQVQMQQAPMPARPPMPSRPPALAAAADAAAVRVLMVCMGNICRSPIAEGVLRAKLQQAGLVDRVLVDSAGTHGYHTNEPPDPRSVRLAAQRGYDLSQQQARPVLPEDFTRFDWLLAMDNSNLAWLHKRKPDDTAGRIELLMAHAKRHPGVVEVPDPYYGPDAGFEAVLNLVEDACDGVVAQLLAQADMGRKA